MRLLASLTRQVAVVQYPSLARSSVRHVELVPISGERLLVVLITTTGRVEQRVIEVGTDLLSTDIPATVHAGLAGSPVTDVHVFGRRGPFDGDDVIDLILARPECGDYIAGRLFDFFAYESPDPALRRGLGDVLREWKYELRPLLHAIFTSKAFYSPQAIGTLVSTAWWRVRLVGALGAAW